MKRYEALDVFRGMTICLMIIVNTPGDWGKTFAPFLHAPWHGFTMTDLVFPSFLFAVGTSLAIVKRKWTDRASSTIFTKIIKRTFLIFLIGYLLSWFPFFRWTGSGEMNWLSIDQTRFWGVLQRIAVCYGAAAVMVYFFSKRQIWFTGILFLLGYWALLNGFGDYSLENNAVRHVDLWLLGENHLYTGDGIPFDPEGLLSTVPAIVNVFGGYLAGCYIIEGKTNKIATYEKVTHLLLVGCILMTLSYFWHYIFPVNKKIWTSSFVTLTIGIDLVLIAAFIYTTELKNKPIHFTFFSIFGKNPLFIYVFSIFLVKVLIYIRPDGSTPLLGTLYRGIFTWLPAYWSSLAFALFYMLLCWTVAWWMDKKKIYIKV